MPKELGKSWSRFTGCNRTASSAPFVSIRLNGDLCFLKKAIKDYELDQYSYANIYWEPTLMQIGVEFLYDKEPTAVKVEYNNSGEFTAPLFPFLRIHNLRPNKSTRYRIEKFIGEDSFMIIDLMDSR